MAAQYGVRGTILAPVNDSTRTAIEAVIRAVGELDEGLVAVEADTDGNLRIEIEVMEQDCSYSMADEVWETIRALGACGREGAIMAGSMDGLSFLRAVGPDIEAERAALVRHHLAAALGSLKEARSYGAFPPTLIVEVNGGIPQVVAMPQYLFDAELTAYVMDNDVEGMDPEDVINGEDGRDWDIRTLDVAVCDEHRVAMELIKMPLTGGAS